MLSKKYRLSYLSLFYSVYEHGRYEINDLHKRSRQVTSRIICMESARRFDGRLI